MSGGEVAALMTAAALLLGAVVAYRKYGPESRKIRVETVDINVMAAEKVNTMTLRFAGEVNQDNEDLRVKIDRIERDFTQYRNDTDARLAEMAIEVRAARAGEVAANLRADSYGAENKQLRGRVQTLEREVASLKANGNS